MNIVSHSDALFVAPADSDPRQTFRIEVRSGIGRIETLVTMGDYAADLLGQMSRAHDEEKAVFASLVRHAADHGLSTQMRVNDVAVEPSAPATWPSDWSTWNFGLVRPRVAIADLSNAEYSAELLRICELTLLLTLSLAATTESPSSIAEKALGGLPEGALQRIEVNRYERSRINRLACIALRGESCLACGLRMKDVYGSSCDGLIHVHHVVPVSKLGPGYNIDPATDLVPLCPNCHAAAHTAEPPLTVEEIAALLIATRQHDNGLSK